jgi:hypothetical protein
MSEVVNTSVESITKLLDLPPTGKLVDEIKDVLYSKNENLGGIVCISVPREAVTNYIYRSHPYGAKCDCNGSPFTIVEGIAGKHLCKTYPPQYR